MFKQSKAFVHLNKGFTFYFHKNKKCLKMQLIKMMSNEQLLN